MLACTAREQLAAVLGVADASSLQVHDRALADRIRNELSGDAMSPLARTPVRLDAESMRLRMFRERKDHTVASIAYLICNGVVHGSFTPTGIGLKRPKRGVLDDLCAAIQGRLRQAVHALGQGRTGALVNPRRGAHTMHGPCAPRPVSLLRTRLGCMAPRPVNDAQRKVLDCLATGATQDPPEPEMKLSAAALESRLMPRQLLIPHWPSRAVIISGGKPSYYRSHELVAVPACTVSRDNPLLLRDAFILNATRLLPN